MKMKKIYLSLITLFTFSLAKSQSTTVNIGNSVGMFDSTFVISGGSNITLNNSNHPGAGPYTNAEILVCEGGVLTYDFMMGTSSEVTFYLDHHATLIFPLGSDGSIANFYVKSNATIQVPSTISIYAKMKREVGANLPSAGISYFSDSLFSNINFTFSGWTNPCLPSSINSIASTNEEVEFQNPVNNKLCLLSNSYSQQTVIHFYNMLGQQVCQAKLKPYQKEIDIELPKGLITYSIRNENQILQKGKLINN